MQVRDDIAWQEQLTEFEADDLSRKFRDFLLFWGDTADQLIADGDFESAAQGHNGNLIMGYAKPIRKALEVAEQTHGYLSVEWIAQMLLVLVTHWYYGEQLYEGLTFIEKRLVEQATAIKLASLQEAAKVAEEQ